MKKLQENLNQYKDFKFFSLFEKENDKDPQKKLNTQEQTQSAKDAQDIIKKVKENFGRFKSYAGNQIFEYKHFWDMQKSSLKLLISKDPSFKYAYALFNDSVSDKYKPNYIVGLKTIEGKFFISVIKTHLEEDEKNPIFSISDKQSCNSFIDFLSQVKEELKSVKDYYIKNVETKKKEEEHKQKREKINKFLKENETFLI